MKILIVDDEQAIADTLLYALSANGFDASSCRLGGEALALAADGSFALIILDVGLPDMSGFDVCRGIRRHSDVPILFLTARAEEIDRIVGLELGADDYVSKPFSPRELVSRVRAILRRTRNHEAEITANIPSSSTIFQVDLEGFRVACKGLWLNLTRYETLLLICLLEHPGRVYSRATLMDKVWTDAEETEERTIDTHVKTLRAKLRSALGGQDPITTHRGLGYSIDP